VSLSSLIQAEVAEQAETSPLIVALDSATIKMTYSQLCDFCSDHFQFAKTNVPRVVQQLEGRRLTEDDLQAVVYMGFSPTSINSS
jgi:orotidine-5'-phosphate decarboxylase